MTTQSENDTVTFQQDIAKETLSNGIYSFGYFPGVTVYTVYIQPLKMELTQGSETSANYNLTPGKYPKEYIQYSNHGESLKSSILVVIHRYFVVCLVGAWQRNFEPGVCVCVYGTAGWLAGSKLPTCTQHGHQH